LGLKYAVGRADRKIAFMKILVVDDHVLIREALRGLLKEVKGDAAVLEAPNCRQAMQLIAEHPDIGGLRMKAHQLVAVRFDEETREAVDAHEKGRGYEIGKGQFLLIEDEELEAIEIESTYTIDIDSFVPGAEIDRRFFDAPYYVTPNDPVGQEAFGVIREAMRSKALVVNGGQDRYRI
jgi:hypothetical protein